MMLFEAFELMEKASDKLKDPDKLERFQAEYASMLERDLVEEDGLTPEDEFKQYLIQEGESVYLDELIKLKVVKK